MQKFATTVMVLLVGILAGSTFLEKFQGSAFVSEKIYHSPLFIVLWALAAAVMILLAVKGKNWKRPAVFILHGAFLLILAGALLSTLTGQHGTLILTPGKAEQCFQTENKGEQPFPFQLNLIRFETIHYPGTQSPMDYVSHIQVIDDEKSVRRNADISMNHILKYRNFRFYQSDFDETGRSVLEVAHDPWGFGVTYAGYVMLLFSLVWIFLEKKGGFRTLLRHPLLQKGAVVVALLLLCAANPLCANPMPRTLPEQTAREMGKVQVLYKGRVCPLGTLAKDFTVKLCGKAHYKGLTPEQVLGGWIFYFEDWVEEPMIKIKGNEVRNLLGINGKYATLHDFTNSEGECKLTAALENCSLGDPMFKKLSAANEKKQIIQMIYNRSLLKIFPIADSAGNLSWYSQNDELPLDLEESEYLFVRKQLNYCQELAVMKDYSSLEEVFAKTVKYQNRNAAGFLPTSLQYRAEICHNRISGGKWIAMLSVTLGLLLFAIYLFRTGKEKALPRPLQLAGLCYMGLLTLFLLFQFVLRWIIGGHVPMAGSHDTMNLLAIFIGAACICLHRRTTTALPLGMLMSGFVLLVSMIGGTNPSVTPLVPVLSSPLLSLHVTVIMMAYALLLFVALNGATALIVGGGRTNATEQMERMRLIGQVLLYPATALLAIGIFIGAVWANISWGRYWSWDPKEVWALITLLVYALPIHDKIWRRFQKPWFFHLYCLIAFLSVLITYFGVNFILGGMHAYN